MYNSLHANDIARAFKLNIYKRFCHSIKTEKTNKYIKTKDHIIYPNNNKNTVYFHVCFCLNWTETTVGDSTTPTENGLQKKKKWMGGFSFTEKNASMCAKPIRNRQTTKGQRQSEVRKLEKSQMENTNIWKTAGTVDYRWTGTEGREHRDIRRGETMRHRCNKSGIGQATIVVGKTWGHMVGMWNERRKGKLNLLCKISVPVRQWLHVNLW